jgi:hypothetical protein
MGCDIASKAKAASPPTGGFQEITALPMWNGQPLVKSLQ